MGYTIRDFIESNKFPVIQLISDNSEMNREIKGVRMIVVPNILTQHEYIRQKRNHVEYIKKINILDQCKFYLVISEVNESLTELDFITLENVISAILYNLTQAVTVRNIEKRYHRDLEYRMLNGSLSGAEEDEVASLLKLNMVDEYQVITFYLKPEIQKEIPLDEQFKRIWIIKVVITPIRETKTVYLEGAYIDDAN